MGACAGGGAATGTNDLDEDGGPAAGVGARPDTRQRLGHGNLRSYRDGTSRRLGDFSIGMNCPAGTAGLTEPTGTLASLALMMSVAFAAGFATDTGAAVPTAAVPTAVRALAEVKMGVAVAEVAAAICCCWCCRA